LENEARNGVKRTHLYKMEIISEKNSNPLITMRRRLKKIAAFTKEFQERKH